MVVGTQASVRRFGALQLTNIDPVAGIASNVMTALLALVVMFGEQSLVIVCDEALVPVPPHVVGALNPCDR